MGDLSITNVVNISLSATQLGVGKFNMANLALFTQETPLSPFPSGYRLYKDPIAVATDFTTGSFIAELANVAFSQTPSFLSAGGYFAVITQGTTETLAQAITRTNSVVQYFGVTTDATNTSSTTQTVAAVVQPLRKMAFIPTNTSADITPTSGVADIIRLAGYYKTRIISYLLGNTDSKNAAKAAMAYASRGMSTNFGGSNTTQTMHLKDLVGITPDTTLDETSFANMKAVGADSYVSFAGVPKTFSGGVNQFFDDVINREWLLSELEVAGFNYLATTNTKIPQTETAMIGFRGAYEAVLETAVRNGYLAPGTWTNAATFGSPENLRSMISQKGYYVYSAPISAQSTADRLARKAPLVQIAYKVAGAVHESDVLVSVNL